MRIAPLFVSSLLLCLSFGCTEKQGPKNQSTETGRGEIASSTKDHSEQVPVTALPKERWNAAYVEKQWGVTLKSVKYTYNKPTASGGPVPSLAAVTFLFEFTKDTQDLKAIRQAFGHHSSGRFATPAFSLCFFDEDNVLFHRTTNGMRIEGEITGKRGDAIRLVLEAPPHLSTPNKVKKAEFRALEPVK